MKLILRPLDQKEGRDRDREEDHEEEQLSNVTAMIIKCRGGRVRLLVGIWAGAGLVGQDGALAG